MKYPKAVLNEGREKSVLNRHPWIFSGALQSFPECEDGSVVEVHSASGDILGFGYFNSRTSICIRLLSFGAEEPVSALRANLSRAADLRRRLTPSGTDAFRVVNGEGDGVPGLIVDSYGGVLVLQCGTLGIERLKAEIVEALLKELKPRAIYEKSDLPSRKIEGLNSSQGWLYGEPVNELKIVENGHPFWVDVVGGQKTGFFLDQREMRALIGALAGGAGVLNCFCYTGGFSVYAARGGAAKIKSIDSSAGALELARRNFELNEIDPARHEFQAADVFEALPSEKAKYDIVILDPPAFAKKRAHIESATQAYGSLNRAGLKLVKGGGYLLTSSCSYYVDERLFGQIVFQAARDCGLGVQILQKHRQAFDHPLSIYHPEGNYLKSLLLSVS